MGVGGLGFRIWGFTVQGLGSGTATKAMTRGLCVSSSSKPHRRIRVRSSRFQQPRETLNPELRNANPSNLQSFSVLNPKPSSISVRM